MAENSNNPLQKYFRQPAIYVKLPSEGKGYPTDTIDIPANGELPIYPMTALDEILSRTPDALYNGSATTEIFKSCVPNIKEPWHIMQTDVDLLLVAIRIASYGHEMEMGSSCPECKESHDFTLDLRTVLDSIKPSDYSAPATIADMSIYFRSLSYKQLNENAIKQFQEQKTLSTSENPDMTEEDKATLLQKSLTNIINLTIDSLVKSISIIQIDGESVSDSVQINEFLVNCERKLFNQIRDHVIGLREKSEIEPLKLTCPECTHEYVQAFTLDQANFFV